MAGGIPQSNPVERASRDEIVALFKQRQQAFDALDASALSEQYTDDCTVESPVAGVIQGRANVEKVYRAWFDAFLDMDLQTEQLLIDGQQVVEVLRIEGTNVGEFMRLPATGKRFHFTGVCLFDLRGLQIERERRIYDFTGLLVQVGVLKARPG